jgi:hypothetical protein
MLMSKIRTRSIDESFFCKFVSHFFSKLTENQFIVYPFLYNTFTLILKATCICHELGHLFIRWRLDSKLNKLEKESKMLTDQFNSPPQYAEAGNFIENRLFGGSTFAYLNRNCNKILGRINVVLIVTSKVSDFIFSCLS